MNEAAKILERLARIRELERDGAPAGHLLAELRELVAEAEAWARVDGDERARAAAGALAAGLARLRDAAREAAVG